MRLSALLFVVLADIAAIGAIGGAPLAVAGGVLFCIGCAIHAFRSKT
jgi:hypothetical protein